MPPLLIALAFGAALLSTVEAREARETSRPSKSRSKTVHTAPDGAALYQLHCAFCHGATGRGDGSDASLFDPPPTDLRGGVLDRYPQDALVQRVRMGTPLSLAREPLVARARAVEVEVLVTHLQRLPTVEWPLVERGKEIYVDRCEVCHGPYGQPCSAPPAGVRPPEDLALPSFQRAHSDTELLIAVRHGRAGMPGLVPRVDESGARALAAFVRLLSPGFELYSRYCASCHGDDGRPDKGPLGAVSRPTVVFDRAYFASRDPEAVRASAWHMLDSERLAMPHLRKSLSEAQTRAILEYVRGLR